MFVLSRCYLFDRLINLSDFIHFAILFYPSDLCMVKLRSICYTSSHKLWHEIFSISKTNEWKTQKNDFIKIYGCVIAITKMEFITVNCIY